MGQKGDREQEKNKRNDESMKCVWSWDLNSLRRKKKRGEVRGFLRVNRLGQLELALWVLGKSGNKKEESKKTERKDE